MNESFRMGRNGEILELDLKNQNESSRQRNDIARFTFIWIKKVKKKRFRNRSEMA